MQQTSTQHPPPPPGVPPTTGPLPIKAPLQKALGGAFWTAGGYGIRQILRFANNLILTRLLFPELFGLMAIVNLFVLGLNLFSDIGLNPAIIQSKRGDEGEFLNTAWTIQVLRGVLLAIGAIFLAWPVSQFYNQPILMLALPVSGLTALFAGFNSTRMAEANRHLRMRELVFVELSAYVIGLVVMIVWALVSPTIWAPVSGGIVTAFCEMVFSHRFLEGRSNRFQWDRSAAREIFRFGRWIFISTALTFLAGQSDRLLIGRLIDFNFLGIYTVAFALAAMMDQGIRQLGYRVLFPSYAGVQRDDPADLYKFLRKSRLWLIGAAMVIGIVLVLFSPQIIDLLYDDRYLQAGWIMRFLALGALFSVPGITYDNVLVARGETRSLAFVMGVQFLLQLAAIFIGLRVAGPVGLVTALSLVGLLSYPFRAFMVRREKLWQPEIDIPYIFVVAILWLVSVLDYAGIWEVFV